jgi:hypothetical protein
MFLCAGSSVIDCRSAAPNGQLLGCRDTGEEVMEYVKADTLSLRKHPDLNEKWVQEIIANDPSVLGLGDLVLKDAERLQPHAGRLDLLLQDRESERRFEVEIQLGRTDESHIIRTIEYWDIERKRFPQYEHTAVIIAEDITSRFFNVIGLFNGVIPLVAIQMNALQLRGQVMLIFTKVLDQTVLGLVDDDDDESEKADRAYWEKRSTPGTLEVTDDLVDILKGIDERLKANYNKFYIGLSRGGVSNNFVTFRPRKGHVQLSVRLPVSEKMDSDLEESRLDLLDYSTRRGRYRFRLKPGDVAKHRDLLKRLFEDSHREATK